MLNPSNIIIKDFSSSRQEFYFIIEDEILARYLTKKN